jgi:hypothetical protein
MRLYSRAAAAVATAAMLQTGTGVARYPHNSQTGGARYNSLLYITDISLPPRFRALSYITDRI